METKSRANLICAAQAELCSATSSLNMYPEPITSYPELLDDQVEYGRVYLSGFDLNAKHAMEHLQKLANVIESAEKVKNNLLDRVFFLYMGSGLSAEAYDALYALIQEL